MGPLFFSPPGVGNSYRTGVILKGGSPLFPLDDNLFLQRLVSVCSWPSSGTSSLRRMPPPPPVRGKVFLARRASPFSLRSIRFTGKETKIHVLFPGARAEHLWYFGGFLLRPLLSFFAFFSPFCWGWGAAKFFLNHRGKM